MAARVWPVFVVYLLAFVAIIAIASEAVVGLGVVLLIWRRTGTGDIDEYVEVEG